MPAPARPRPLRLLAALPLAALVASLLTVASPAAALPDGLDLDDALTLQAKSGATVDFLGARLPAEAVAGKPLPLQLFFKATGPLPPTSWVFVHVESTSSRCRVVLDRQVTQPGADGLLTHTLEVTVPTTAQCGPQRLEVRAGLYERGTGRRFTLRHAVNADDRVHAAYLHLVTDTPDSEPRTLTPSDMRMQRWIAAATPWRSWGLGLLFALILGLVGRFTLGAKLPPVPSAALTGWLGRVPLLLLGGLSVLSIIVAIDFVKDDAYISFRYAHNVVVGQGLVFNAHDKLEGITNFLWTVVLVPFEALGLDLFQVTEVLGSALILWLLWSMTRLSGALGGEDKTLSNLWAALVIASSSSVSLWTTSGMEQPLAMALPVAGTWWLWRSWRRPDDADAQRDALVAGVLVGLGCMTRPDIHLMGVLLAVPLLVRALRTRRLDPVLLRFAAGGLLVTVPGHGFRYLYYGALMPNTFYVKTGGGWLVWLKGLQALREMWGFNAIGALALLAPFAFLRRRFLAEKLTLGLISVGYMLYLVKVGRDEMHWHRLYLPALPFLAWLAGLGLAALCDAVAALIRRPWGRPAAYALGWAAVAALVVTSFQFTWRHQHGLNGRGDLSGNYHPDMGKFVTRHARPGALVAFQDMGSTPYHAPDLDFFDFIGLTDRVVARTRHRYGLHAFLETSAQRYQGEYDKEMRAYFHTQRPEWVILTSYVHGGAHMDAVAKRFEKVPTPESLGYVVGSNRYQFGVYNSEFKRKYTHVRTWPRSRSYYLSLFYLKDLWQQVPREVVFDKAPADVHGVKATWDRGVELIGSDLPADVTAKQEFYLTLWLDVAGPLEKDWWVFVHLEKPGYRHPADHVPGDWMWPADRWRKGDVVEDRSLVQLPPFMAPGTYDVWVGMYRRSTWERLKVLKGPKDGENRVKVGRITVHAQRPFVDQLIRPTRLSEDRKHPERIPDHGRAPTAYAERAAKALEQLLARPAVGAAAEAGP